MNRSLTPRTALRLLPAAAPVKPSATATYVNHVNHVNREIERTVLGSTLTTNTGQGANYREASAHEQVRRTMAGDAS